MIHPSQRHFHIRARQPDFEEARIFARSLMQYV
jgi:hypothetical protein